MGRLAELIDRHRRRVLALAGLLFIAGVTLGAPVAGELKATSADFQDRAAENLRAVAQVQRAQGRDPEQGMVVLVPTRQDVRTSKAARAQVERVAAGVRRVPGIEGVSVPRGRQLERLSARDGRLTVVTAAIPSGGGAADAADEVRAEFGAQGVQVGGRNVTFASIGDKVSEDLARAELMAFPLLFLLSLWIFRSAVSALLPPLIGGLSIVTTFIALRFVDHNVTPLSIFALNLVTGLGLGLAIDYSLFVVNRYREELAQHGPGLQALRNTLNTAGRTVLYSSLTVAAAIASMGVFPLKFLYSMAIGGAIVALVAMLISLTVLPALLVALGPKVDALALKRWRVAAQAAARPAESGGWYRLAHGVMRRPGLVALVTATLLIVVGLPFLRVNFVSADYKMLPPGNEARLVSETLEREFPDAAADPIRVVASGPGATAAAVRAYRAQLVAKVDAPVGPAQRLGGPENVWEIDVRAPGDPISDANVDRLRDVRDAGAPFDVNVSGSAAAFVDQQDALGAKLPLALTMLAITTFLILFLMTGSVVLPLKALVMNLLSLSAAFGVLVLVFQDGRLEGLLDYRSAGGLEATQPVLLFATSFGLATDYGVFLLSRIKEARDSGLSDREAVAFGVERTGRIITAAAILFCVAIGAFSTSGVVFIKQLGIGTALAVFIDATIIRALLVPALMSLLGHWNWWAPRPLKRLHTRIGLSEA